MFKQATLFKVSLPNPALVTELDLALAEKQFQPCGPTQTKSIGFVPPRGEVGGAMLAQVDSQLLLRLAIETKAVPGQAVKKRTDELIKKFQDHTGVKPGKKITKELKETAVLELLPAAFPKLKHVTVWIDPKAGIMLVDAVGSSTTDDVTMALVNAIDGLQISYPQTEMSPAVAMTHWLGTGEAPYQFTVDRECELHSTDEMRSVIKYGRHNLDTDEIRAHITSGKVPTKLALTWRDRVSFVMDDCMRLKKITFLDVVFESVLANAGKVDKGEVFDADAAIATGEFKALIPDLFEALGGLQLAEGGAA